uniref:Putative ionotropic receptor IR2 n=1 Tax=Cydia fagiglandana TaxID=1458189 RepID=A0A223HDA7_9NEOP|nr:putative ionotropic receptor IR2 [Cydia fagiglandana]
MQGETFTVASTPDCITVLRDERNDPLWRETQVGCRVLLLLQEIHKFNITYTEGYHHDENGLYVDDVDIFAKPWSLWSPIMVNCTPIAPVMDWKFGYILRRPIPNIQHFYSLAFSTPTWNVIAAMILLVSVLFYILNRAEQKLSGENLKCYFWRELLTAFGIICQHYISISPMELSSRRIAFISFSLFSYIIYCYYTSTLLSDLVHDRDNEMDLESLGESDYEHAVLDTVAGTIKVVVEQLHNNNKLSSQRLSLMQDKLTNHRLVNISTGLAEVKSSKTALLSDYVSIHSAVIQSFTDSEVCDLIKVDMFSNVLKYLVTSKNFKYIEEFKMSTLRAREAGVLHRLLSPHTAQHFETSECVSAHFQAHFGLVRKPFIILVLGYVLCGFILLGERVHYNRYKVWPYVN